MVDQVKCENCGHNEYDIHGRMTHGSRMSIDLECLQCGQYQTQTYELELVDVEVIEHGDTKNP